VLVAKPRSHGWLCCVPIVATLVLVTACGASGTPPAPHSSGSAPSPAPVGKVAGDPVTKSIGPAGGSLSSADGRITINIPSGALANATPVAIQPIENTAASGLGAAYRLSPAGQTFTKPVQVSFPYVDADLAGTAPEALGIAFQDARGLWEWQQSVALDQGAKQVSVMTTHFTDWSKVAGLQLRPGSATVRVSGHVTLNATSCIQRGEGDLVYLNYACGDVTDELSPLVEVIPATWSVNGSAGGSPTFGNVKGDALSATYSAPAKKPSANTVAVSVQAKIRGGTMLLVANVTIIDGYRVTGSFQQTNSELVCSGAISSLVTDTVAFTLTPSAGGGYTVTDIKNAPTKFAAPKVPIVAVGASVVTAPDIFSAKDGAVEATGDQTLVTVAVNGTTTLGVCKFGGVVLGTGQTQSDRTGLAFYTSKFVNGVQTNLPEDTGEQHWTWTVTQN
jgi:hypothetical protein